MSLKHFDVVVAGTGSMGSAACAFLAHRGYAVLGLEQSGTVPHANGSHSGQSRIIRKAYFEDPDYVPLLERAYQNWQALEKASGHTLYHETGLLYVAPPGHPLLAGVKKAAAAFSIPLQPAQQHPARTVFNLPGAEFLLEPGAGFLLPESCIRAFLQQALAHHATIHTGEKMLSWEKQPGYIRVQTNKDVYHCRKLIITAGAWSEPAIRRLPVTLTVTRQLLLWAEPDDPSFFLPEQFPCWLLADETLEGAWYGFPYLSGPAYPGPPGLKFALHHAGEATAPDQVQREISAAELQTVTQAAQRFFRPAGCRISASSTCLYTNSSDENFIIDFLPGTDKDVVIACGFSGHGFKFASVIGEVLAELATRGSTELPIGFLSLNRFQS